MQLTAQALAAIVVRELADFCGVETILADGHVQRLAAEHADPDVARAFWDLYHATDRRVGPLLSHVIEAGEPLIAHLDPDVARLAAEAGRAEMLRLLDVRSLMIVPLRRPRRPRERRTATSSSRRFDDDDLALLRELADRGARALENARLYEDAQAARAAAERVGAGAPRGRRTASAPPSSKRRSASRWCPSSRPTAAASCRSTRPSAGSPATRPRSSAPARSAS